MNDGHEHPIAIALERENAFRFRIRFDHVRARDLVTDEPPPLGAGAGPNPVELLGAAVGSCLASSLLFCMEKAHLEPRGLEATIEVTKVRNSEGRLRVGRIAVRLVPAVTTELPERLRRCAELFESYCTVAESVREGIPIEVFLEPRIVHDTSGTHAPSAPRSIERHRHEENGSRLTSTRS